MKLVLAIISNDDASKVSKGLVKENFFVTKLATTGGFLLTGNTTFLVGTNDEKVIRIIEIIEEHSKTRSKLVPNSIVSEFGMFSSLPVEVKVGGATVFVMNVEQFMKI
ncbi:MAG TPA: cyclic-di-AMP receptor [Acholeplasma sp.]|nr:cyclic-di-AMP receptor [Acholeplasma sp.]